MSELEKTKIITDDRVGLLEWTDEYVTRLEDELLEAQNNVGKAIEALERSRDEKGL